jgi:hypothetical protein
MITVVSVHLRVEGGDGRIHDTEVAGAFDTARDATAARAIGAQLGGMVGEALALRLQGEGAKGRAA